MTHRSSKRDPFPAWVYGAVAAVVLAGAGCSTFKPDVEQAAPEVEESVLPERIMSRRGPQRAKLWDEAPLIVDEVVPADQQTMEQKVEFPAREVRETPKVPISEYPENLIKGIKDPDETVKVWLNLDATPLTEVVPMFAAPEMLNFSYLIDPGVKGAVTMSVDSEMTARQAWEMFEHILWLAGAYASKNPGFIHILPFDKMPKERRLLIEHDPHANVEVAFLPVRYKKSSEVLANVKPFMTDGATITDLPADNVLLIVEAPANMPKLRELVNHLDSKGEAQWPHICLQCHEVDAEEVLADLEALLPVLGFPVSKGGGPSGGTVKLTVLPRIQCIVASAALQEVLDEVEKWFEVLDRTDMWEKENIFFYNVEHGTAEQLNEALVTFFNAEATTSSRPSRTKSTSSKAGATTGTTGDTGTDARSRNTPSRSSASRSRQREEGERDTIFDTPVVVYVDNTQNRLTIRTTQRAFALVQALLERQDVAPRQVSIQAIIADITLTKNTQFGFTYYAKKLVSGGKDTLELISAGAGELPTALSNGYGFLFQDDQSDPIAFLNLVAGEGNTRVLSEPQVIALSDEQAIINVGQRVPIPTEQTNYSGDADNFRTNYEYQDTGVIMTVTPHVTAGNDVRLEVKQEVSDAAESEDPTIPPRITNKVVESVLTVPDGSTVMMGGLIRTKSTDSNSGIPYLKDVPYVGRVFRSNSSSDERSELLILITVNVIENEDTVQHLITRYAAALEEIRKQDRQ
jgi:general secretion pathway protein D